MPIKTFQVKIHGKRPKARVGDVLIQTTLDGQELRFVLAACNCHSVAVGNRWPGQKGTTFALCGAHKVPEGKERSSSETIAWRDDRGWIVEGRIEREVKARKIIEPAEDQVFRVQEGASLPLPQVDDELTYIDEKGIEHTCILARCDCYDSLPMKKEGVGWPEGNACGAHRVEQDGDRSGLAWHAESRRWFFSGTLVRRVKRFASKSLLLQILME